MSRFSKVYEDPEYDDDLTWEDDEADWEDGIGDLGSLAPSLFVAEKQQEEYGPYETINS
jgi:hypothetical protein